MADSQNVSIAVNPELRWSVPRSPANALFIGASGMGTILTVSADGKLTIGAGLQMDAAARQFIDALEGQIKIRITSVDTSESMA